MSLSYGDNWERIFTPRFPPESNALAVPKGMVAQTYNIYVLT